LIMVNRTDEDVTFAVERANIGSLFLVNSGNYAKTNLAAVGGDRVIYAAKQGSNPYPFAYPFKVYAVNSFNASTWPGPAITAVLLKDGGDFKLVYLLVGSGGEPILPPQPNAELKRLFEQHKEAIQKALGRPQPDSPVT
jgi:hypothetical protein